MKKIRQEKPASGLATWRGFTSGEGSPQTQMAGATRAILLVSVSMTQAWPFSIPKPSSLIPPSA